MKIAINKIIILLVTITYFAACAVQQKATYEFPAEMAEPVKNEFAKVCEKGKVLYAINCAGCHNIKKGKKELIPDFTPEQIKGYEIRVSNAEHERSMPDELVTPEELGQIAIFLQYKTRSGISVSTNK